MVPAWSISRAFKRRALLGRGQRRGVALVPPQTLDQGLGGVDQGFERGAAAFLDDIVGILARRAW